MTSDTRNVLTSLAAAMSAACVSTPVGASLIAVGNPVAWDGDCSNAIWNSMCGVGGGLSNWNTDGVPTSGDDVTLSPSDPVVLLPGVAGSAASISCVSGINITSNGSLSLGGNSTIHNLAMNSTSVTGLRIQGGEVLLETACGWVQGRMTGAGSVKNRGMMTGSPNVQDTAMFFNQATANLSTLTVGANAMAINGTGANMTLGNTNGTGTFTNLGTLTFAHSGNATYNMGCPFVQHDGGTLVVTGATTGEGTIFNNNSTFDGGTLTVANEGDLRFRGQGAAVVHTFNGLPAITGNGNVYVEMPSNGDWRVEEQGLNVNLTGLDGFVMDGVNLTLNGVLRNQGNALWSHSRLREGGGGIAPEFRNEGSLTIYTSGVVLDAFLSNEAGGTIVHEVGPIALEDDGVVINFGTYEHRRGGIARVFGGASGSFYNNGTYKRPNHPDTQDETIQGPFFLSTGSTARYEKATTTYTSPGLFMLGGDVIIEQNAALRASTAEAHSTTNVTGSGEFLIEGFGGQGSFVVAEDVTVNVSLPASTGGEFVLSVGGRIGGPGRVRNNEDMEWIGGSVGLNGSGQLFNNGRCRVQSGIVNAGGEFVNQDERAVIQTGVFTLTSSEALNFGLWEITSGIAVQGNGTHLFNNQGEFRCSKPAGQTATVSARFSNGELVHADSGILQFTGQVNQLVGTTLNGGTWKVDAGATLDLPGTITTIGPSTIIDCNGTWNDLRSVTLNRGSLGVQDLSFLNSQFVNDGGTVQLAPPMSLINNGNGDFDNNDDAPSASVIDPVTTMVLTGGDAGELPFVLRCANLNNRSLVRPGGPGAAGPFKMDGNFNQFDTGVLQVELGGETAVEQHDQLIVDGNVVLDGHLHVRVLPGYAPEGGEQFTIISASNGTIFGTFDAIDGPGQYTLSYSPTSVTLTLIAPPQPGDTNNDGATNSDDLVNVILQWGLCPQPPAFCAADLNGDGFVNADDLITVILNWD